MRLTINSKLAIGTGLLLSLFAVFGAIVYIQVVQADKELESITVTHMPALQVLTAIEDNIVSIGYHTIGYMHGERQIHLDRIDINRGELASLIERFREIGAAGGLEAELSTIEARQRDFVPLIDRLIQAHNAQGERTTLFVAKLAEIDTLLDTEMQKTWAAQGAPAQEKLVASMEIEINTNGLAKAIGNYMLLPDERHHTAFDADVDDCSRSLKQLEGLVSGATEERWVKRLGILLAEATVVGSEVFAAEDALRENLATFAQLRQDFRRDTLDPFKEKIIARFEQSRVDASDASSRAMRFTVFGLLAGILVGGLVSIVTSRTISNPLREALARLASSSAEIQAATTEQASGAEEQASAVSQSVSTVDELQHISEQATQRVKAIVENARKTESVSEEGSRAVGEANQSISQVRERVEAVAGNILSLAERMQAIGEIIATVNDMADQTNLLALNASIEASRAGVEGKGFAVVAREIKSLADQSKGATAQVRQILLDIQKATNDAVLATEESTKSVAVAVPVLGRAGETIASLSKTITEAAQASVQALASAGQQSTGMAQIQQAMRSIDQATRQNLSATRQVEQAARDLGEISKQLRALVGRQEA